MAYILADTHQPCKGARLDLPTGLKELVKLTEVTLSRNVNAFEGMLNSY